MNKQYPTKDGKGIVLVCVLLLFILSRVLSVSQTDFRVRTLLP